MALWKHDLYNVQRTAQRRREGGAGGPVTDLKEHLGKINNGGGKKVANDEPTGGVWNRNQALKHEIKKKLLHSLGSSSGLKGTG